MAGAMQQSLGDRAAPRYLLPIRMDGSRAPEPPWRRTPLGDTLCTAFVPECELVAFLT